MPLPEKTFIVGSVITQEEPVARNMPSSHAENHIVQFAKKMNRRMLVRARWTKDIRAASVQFLRWQCGAYLR